MAMTSAGSTHGTIASINVTPMADVMIVLLIIFMVMTPLVAEGPVRALPSAENAREQEKGSRTVSVSVAFDAAYLGSLRLDTVGELLPKLQERLDALPQGARVVFVRADEGLPYSRVWEVLLLCRQAGVEQVALVARDRTRRSR